MESLRLSYVSSILKNARRIEAKLCYRNNLGVIFRRTNHSLCQHRLITAINHDSPKLFSNLNKYWIVYRLEHGGPAANILTSAVKDITENSSSESLPKSSDSKQMVENISGPGKISEIKGVNENLNVVDESMLPPIPDNSVTIIEEVSLKSLGLAGWSPTGIVQQILEFFHTSFGMPWWAAIVALTLTLRFFMIPFTIKMRKDMTNYSNHIPQYQQLQNKVSEAKRCGSYYEVAQASQELHRFMLEKKMFSLGMAVPYVVQMPIFISVFLALKRMSETPELRSFETGGILWFTDLSVPDQFYILPIMTAGTIWLTLRFGSNSHALQSSPRHMQSLIEIVVPTVIFLATMHFPAATACYWTTTNIFVLIQNRILAVEPIRKYLDIPKSIVNISFGKTANPNKGIVEGFKEAYENMKLTREIEDRERLNAVKFEENASAPIRRTFKFNPKEIPRTGKLKQTM